MKNGQPAGCIILLVPLSVFGVAGRRDINTEHESRQSLG